MGTNLHINKERIALLRNGLRKNDYLGLKLARENSS